MLRLNPAVDRDRGDTSLLHVIPPTLSTAAVAQRCADEYENDECQKCVDFYPLFASRQEGELVKE